MLFICSSVILWHILVLFCPGESTDLLMHPDEFKLEPQDEFASIMDALPPASDMLTSDNLQQTCLSGMEVLIVIPCSLVSIPWIHWRL